MQPLTFSVDTEFPLTGDEQIDIRCRALEHMAARSRLPVVQARVSSEGTTDDYELWLDLGDIIAAIAYRHQRGRHGLSGFILLETEEEQLRLRGRLLHELGRDLTEWFDACVRGEEV